MLESKNRSLCSVPDVRSLRLGASIEFQKAKRARGSEEPEFTKHRGTILAKRKVTQVLVREVGKRKAVWIDVREHSRTWCIDGAPVTKRTVRG